MYSQVQFYLRTSTVRFEAWEPNTLVQKTAAALQNANHRYCVNCDENARRATIQTSLGRFFKRVHRIESSQKPGPVPQSSGMSETAVCSVSCRWRPFSSTLSPSSPSSCQQLFASSLDASPCTPAVVPYFSIYCTITLKMTFLLVINVYPCLLND